MSQSKAPRGEKTMSSRLMTMKFMQRAVASKEQDQDANSPTPKRARLSTDGDTAPAQPSSELKAMEAAVAAEEGKRKEALMRQAAEAGETEWVLDFAGAGQTAASPPVIVDAGSLDDEDVSYGGRQTYGNFKRKKKNISYVDGEDDDDEVDRAQVKKSKPQPVNLKHVTSISGARNPGGASEKKRKQK